MFLLYCYDQLLACIHLVRMILPHDLICLLDPLLLGSCFVELLTQVLDLEMKLMEFTVRLSLNYGFLLCQLLDANFDLDFQSLVLLFLNGQQSLQLFNDDVFLSHLMLHVHYLVLHRLDC